VALTAPVAACGLEPRHGYIQSPDGSLSFRHPREWTQVELAPVSVEWVTGVDAAHQPSVDNINTFVLDHPFVVAQVYPLDQSVRDGATLGSLRLLALPDRRDPAASDDPTIRLQFHETVVDEHGFEGHHLRLEVDLDDGTAVEEQFAVFDPQRTRIHRVRVACSASCFDANVEEIEALFRSLMLRP
jgi:hypothetical protein